MTEAQPGPRQTQQQQPRQERRATLEHELRNVLNALTVAGAVLARCEPGSDPDRRAREVVQRQVELLTVLVNELLAARAPS